MSDVAKSKAAARQTASGANPDAKKRGPVKYHAFAELAPGWWALVAADREASSQVVLRRELRAEIQDAQAEAGVQITDSVQLVIVPSDRAYVVTATRTMTVTETFAKSKLSAAAPIASMIAGPPQPHAPTEAELAARAGAGPPPPGADEPQPPSAPPLPQQGNAADMAAAERAHAAAIAAGSARAPGVAPDEQTTAATPAFIVDDDDGLAKRPASQARPDDEGRTVFPLDTDHPDA